MLPNRRPPLRRKAVVLLSGGLDSATVLYDALSKGYRCSCLIVDYGQRHRREIRSARAVARAAGCPTFTAKVRVPWGGSALTDRKIRVPLDRFRPAAGAGGSAATRFCAVGRGIPPTYVPARNTIFLSLALGFAETTGAEAVFIGANFLDASGYPDCRPRYYRLMQGVVRAGTRAGAEGKGIRIMTPLIRLTKAQIIRKGLRLGVPYEKTWSCYLGGRRPCSRCDSCLLRAKGFRETGAADPAILVQ